jgi:hypothetical protein
MATNYAVGQNEPGCLPDNSPIVRSTFDDAKAALIWDLKFWEDSAEDEATAEAFCAAAEDVNLWAATDRTDAWEIMVGGRVFWIMVTDEDADR